MGAHQVDYCFLVVRLLYFSEIKSESMMQVVENEQSDTREDLQEWVAPCMQSHRVSDLTQAGGVLTTDGGGLGNDCS